TVLAPSDSVNHKGKENAKSKPTTTSRSRHVTRCCDRSLRSRPASNRTRQPDDVASASQMCFRAPTMAPDQSTASTRTTTYIVGGRYAGKWLDVSVGRIHFRDTQTNFKRLAKRVLRASNAALGTKRQALK